MFERDILVGFICFKVKNLEFNNRQALSKLLTTLMF